MNPENRRRHFQHSQVGEQSYLARLRVSDQPLHLNPNVEGDASPMYNYRRNVNALSAYGLATVTNLVQLDINSATEIHFNRIPTIRLNLRVEMQATGILNENLVATVNVEADPHTFRARPFRQPNENKTIFLCGSTLYSPLTDLPFHHEKPLGCKTVFVGGYPQLTTEDVIREVLSLCGDIVHIQMSRHNFCHVRFSSEESTDHAVYFSGYRIILNHAGDDNAGRLIIDYAVSALDKDEYRRSKAKSRLNKDECWHSNVKQMKNM